jgi:hypothetical protein
MVAIDFNASIEGGASLRRSAGAKTTGLYPAANLG